MSSLFLRTLREDPADAEVPSHKLLVRAGTSVASRRASTPGCHWACGCCATSSRWCARRWTPSARQEIQFPALLPREPYEATNRWTEYGHIFRFRTARAATTCSGPPTRSCSPSSVKGEYASYKDYPVILYQIQTKYRDEERPAPASCAAASS